jgi:hypothetical protein
MLDPASGSPAAVARSNYAPCPCLVTWCSFSGCGRTCLWFRYGLSLGCGCRGGGPSLTPGVPIPCRRLPFGILPFSCALGCPIGRGPQSHPVGDSPLSPPRPVMQRGVHSIMPGTLHPLMLCSSRLASRLVRLRGRLHLSRSVALHPSFCA